MDRKRERKRREGSLRWIERERKRSKCNSALKSRSVDKVCDPDMIGNPLRTSRIAPLYTIIHGPQSVCALRWVLVRS